ncbi:MAG: hypothetical protein JOZ49_10155 [Mycolicibacterium sp.]|nr:hypothetical protein [Mycolicibacterium sp.]
MEVTTRAITLASAAVVLLGGCNTNATAGLPHNGSDNPIMSPAPMAAPNRAVLPPDTEMAAPRGAVPPPRTEMAAPSRAVPPPDPEGNPACPLSDAWGKAPTDNGIFITYWDNQNDYVTALVRTYLGTDYAKSASIDAFQQPLIFDFPDVDAATVREVLITTNVERCFATPDPATSGR